MMNILRVARSAGLPDWMIGAGFVRNRVWDELHEFAERHRGDDVDLIYFDPLEPSEATDKQVERELGKLVAVNWSVKNQARMHAVHGDPPYESTEDALANWVETATCVAVTLLPDDGLKLIAPHGLDDLVNLVIRANPARHDPESLERRVRAKRWLEIWPKLRLIKPS